MYSQTTLPLQQLQETKLRLNYHKMSNKIPEFSLKLQASGLHKGVVCFSDPNQLDRDQRAQERSHTSDLETALNTFQLKV